MEKDVIFMTKSSALTSKLAQTWIVIGIPILFIVGSLFHFAYEWSGELWIVGIFAPVNESIWEHLKMAYWPTLIWWIIGYYRICKRHKISEAQWFFPCMVSVYVSPLVITAFYYTYTGAFGIESVILDIFSLLLGIAIGQLLALHIYNYANLRHTALYLSIALIFILALAFTVFTFSPPHLPLFLDQSTGTYGI